MTTVIIEDNSPQARSLLAYIETLPFATVKKRETTSRRTADDTTGKWAEAIARGAISLEQFDARFKEEIRKAYLR
jgi:hypothetical protein